MAKEYFPQIGKIPFEGTESKNVMAFHYYQPERVVMGKKIKDWLKFAMAWWHTLGQIVDSPSLCLSASLPLSHFVGMESLMA